MPILRIDNPAQHGIITDMLPMQLPPNAWSAGRNVRFRDNKVVKFKGHEEYFDPGLNWDGGTGEQVYYLTPYYDEANGNYVWVYCGLNDVRIGNGGAIDAEITNVGGDFSATADRNWTSGILGTFLILNNGVDVPQTWTGDSSTPSKLVDLANWTGTHTCGAMRVYKNYLIALDVTKAGTRYKDMVKWSHSAGIGALPTSWDETDITTDAGEVDLAERAKDRNVGALLDCMPMRNSNIIYSDSQTWVQDFIGGINIFSFRQLLKTQGMLSRRCMSEFNGNHFVIGTDDIFVHNGSHAESVIDSKRRRFFFNDLDSANYERVFAFHNPAETEMWVCYPQDGGTGLPNTALVWNYKHGTWGQRDLPDDTPHIEAGIADTSVADDSWSNPGVDEQWDTGTSEPWDTLSFNPQSQSPVSGSDKLYRLDATNTLAGTNMASSIERTDIPIGEQDEMVRIKAAYPRMEGDAAVNIYVGSHLAPGDSPNYGTPISFTPGTDIKVDVRKTGTHAAVKIESTGDQEWEAGGFDIEYEVIGRRK